MLEAVGWVARARSFRGVADALLVRRDTEQAIVRAEVTTGDRGRSCSRPRSASAGRNRIMCNKQTVARSA